MWRNWVCSLFGRLTVVAHPLRRGTRLTVESLEARTLLATLSVNISGCAPSGVYCQIQQAVDAASPGDTINVASGTYKFVVIETKNITIREANRNSNPVIDATLSPLNGGVWLNASGVTIKGLEVRNSPFNGFFVGGDNNPANNTLQDNTARGNRGSGFHLAGTVGNMLIGNTAIRNKEGFRLNLSSGNTLQRNTARGNRNDGFLVMNGSANNTLKGNTAKDNGEDGFEVQGGLRNTLYENGAEDNDGDGFEINGGGGNLLRKNEAEDNGGDGFRLVRTDNNTLNKNEAEDNGEYGFFVDALLGNIFQHNECGDNGLGGANLAGICHDNDDNDHKHDDDDDY